MQNIPTKFFSWISDGITVLFFLLFGGHLIERFGRESNEHSLERIIDTDMVYDTGWVVLPYFLFLIGIMTLVRMKGNALPAILTHKWFIGISSVIFSIGITLLLSDVTGFLDNSLDAGFGDVGDSYYKVFTPGFYLFAGLLYLFFMITKTDPVERSRKSQFRYLLFTGLFTAIVSAYLGAILPMLYPNMSKLVGTILIAFCLVLFFAIPRIIYGLKKGDLLSILSADILFLLLAICAGYQLCL